MKEALPTAQSSNLFQICTNFFQNNDLLCTLINVFCTTLGFSRMVDIPPPFLQPYQLPFGPHHSPPFVSSTSSFPHYDPNIYPPSRVSPYFSPPYAVDPSSLPPNPYFYFPGIKLMNVERYLYHTFLVTGIPMSSSMPLSSSSNPFLPSKKSHGRSITKATVHLIYCCL